VKGRRIANSPTGRIFMIYFTIFYIMSIFYDLNTAFLFIVPVFYGFTPEPALIKDACLPV
jgi:hypothetical protein